MTAVMLTAWIVMLSKNPLAQAAQMLYFHPIERPPTHVYNFAVGLSYLWQNRNSKRVYNLESSYDD